MQGVWSLLLSQYSSNKDIVFGVTVSGRPDDMEGVEKKVGMYINTIPTHASFEENMDLDQWLQELQNEQLASREFQFTSISDVKRWCNISGDLFDTLFVFENFPLNKLLTSHNWSLKVENIQINEHTNYPLTVIVFSAEQIHIRFNYNSTQLSQLYVEQIKNHFFNVLDQIITQKVVSTHGIDVVTEGEKLQLLNQFNTTEKPYSAPSTIIELFEAQVKQTPNTPAVSYGTIELSYSELNIRANQLANYLIEKGVSPQKMVPVCLERSADLIIALIAILKTGAAYVPIDPEYPEQRINFMLGDIEADLIITNKACSSKISAKGILKIELDTNTNKISQLSESNLTLKYSIESLAYVIYTSGSTGTPKGVMIQNKAFVNLIRWHQDQYQVKFNSKTTAMAGVGFDAFGWEIWPYLTIGAHVNFIDDEKRMRIPELCNFFIENGISHSFIATALVPEFVEQTKNKKTSLQFLLTGGDKLQSINCKGIDYQLVNNYGPTEYSVVTSFYPLSNDENYSTPIIGKPIANTQVYIIHNNKLCPVGVIGEIAIAGKGLAKGYLNNEILTDEKFVNSPFTTLEEEKMYLTGDLGRWLPDGNIEYAGRKDDQVKIRGFRIELGEIESVVQQSGFIKQNVVLIKEDRQSNKRLIGYIVHGQIYEKDKFQDYLKERLPEYMIPQLWMELTELPLTPNGKIDKKALPDPDISILSAQNYVAPQNPTQSTLIDIWKEVLEIEKPGIHDNFFEIGGHSLLAMRVIAGVRKQLDLELGVKDIFTHPTVEQLANFILSKESSQVLTSIKINARPEKLPLSFSQERLWFIDRLEGSVQYHIPAVLKLTGKLNITALELAIKTIFKRHEILRTTIKEEDGKGYQFVNNLLDWNLLQTNVSNKNEEQIQTYILQQINTPFNLSEDLMLRAELLSHGNDAYTLLVVLHHIASDGWSTSILVKEVVEIYNAIEKNREPQLPKLEIQYADFAVWQRDYLKEEVLETKLAYWKSKLTNVTPIEIFPDKSRPAIQSIHGASLGFNLDNSEKEQLELISNKAGVTLFMTLLSAFKVLLFKYTGQSDICVGTPVAGRQHKEVEPLIGYFINTLALRSELQSETEFVDLLNSVKTTTLEAFDHQDVPFEKVVEEVVTTRDLSRSPLFQVFFIYQNTPEIPEFKLGDVELTASSGIQNTVKFDISFSLTETSNGIVGNVQYCTDLYNQSSIERLIHHFKNLIGSIIQEPKQSLIDLSILKKEEEISLIRTFNGNTADYPKDKTVLDFFKAQVKNAPDEIAVVFENQSLTYLQLDEKSNQLAHFLRSKGVKEETLVPICIERSLEMMIGIWGILKAGGAYVPLDPEYPQDRIDYMMEDTNAKVILIAEAFRGLLKVNGSEIIALDTDWNKLSDQPLTPVDKNVKASQLAYVIYTSGSTGKPKGVMNQHDGLLNRLLWAQDYYQLTPEDRVLQKTTFSFDVSVWELIWPLLVGAKIVLAKPGGHKDGEYLKQIIESSKISMLHFVPSMLEGFLAGVNEGECTGLKKVLCSGEALKRSHVDAVQTKTTFCRVAQFVWSNGSCNRRYILVGIKRF
jgi:amino acid adenylation domain-containing protein